MSGKQKCVVTGTYLKLTCTNDVLLCYTLKTNKKFYALWARLDEGFKGDIQRRDVLPKAITTVTE